jgi:hypothetical protein
MASYVILSWGIDQFGGYGSDVVAVFGNEVEVEKYLSCLSSFELESKLVEQWADKKIQSWSGEEFISQSK